MPLILVGSHGHSSCLGGHKGYLKPRLAVQNSHSTPRPHYSLPHKAIYAVWQHSSYKQRESTDSGRVKGSGSIFFFFFQTSDFFEFDCNFSSTLMPALPQRAQGVSSSPLHCKQLYLAHGWRFLLEERVALAKRRLFTGKSTKEIVLQCWDYSALGTTKMTGEKNPQKTTEQLTKVKCTLSAPPTKIHITHDQRLRGCANGCWHNPACPSPLPQASTGGCGQAPVSPG